MGKYFIVYCDGLKLDWIAGQQKNTFRTLQNGQCWKPSRRRLIFSFTHQGASERSEVGLIITKKI